MKKMLMAHLVAFMSWSFIGLGGITLIKQSTDNKSSFYLKKGIKIVGFLIPKDSNMERIADVLTYSSLGASLVGLLYWGYILKNNSVCKIEEERQEISEDDEKTTIISQISKKSSEFDYSDARNPLIIGSASSHPSTSSSSLPSSIPVISNRSSFSSLFNRKSCDNIECYQAIYALLILVSGIVLNVSFAYLGMSHELIPEKNNPGVAENGHYLPINSFFEISLFLMRIIGSMVLISIPVISIGEMIRNR